MKRLKLLWSWFFCPLEWSLVKTEGPVGYAPLCDVAGKTYPVMLETWMHIATGQTKTRRVM